MRALWGFLDRLLWKRSRCCPAQVAACCYLSSCPEPWPGAAVVCVLTLGRAGAGWSKRPLQGREVGTAACPRMQLGWLGHTAPRGLAQVVSHLGACGQSLPSFLHFLPSRKAKDIQTPSLTLNT